MDDATLPTCGSLFSGIGGLDLGLARAGFRHAFLCESDPWRRDVLAHHFPGAPIYEDVGTFDAAAWSTRNGTRRRTLGGAQRASAADAALGNGAGVDLLCGGFPCQDVSVAGRRRGLAGERSGLFFEFARVAESLRPRWLLVENVPGLLSSQGGRDFGAVLGTLADFGYGLAWRILDSRYFGVPQRRRRVFVLGALASGDPRAAAERAGAVLAVGSRCERHPAAGTEARKDLAGTLGGGSGSRGWAQDTERMTFVADTVRSHPRPGSNSDGNLVAAPLSHGSNPNSNMAGRRREDDENLVAYPIARRGREDGAELEVGEPGLYNARRAGDGGSSRANEVLVGQSVRRLMPIECERLQALPDGWTNPNGDAPDSRRYAALGDAVTVSVAQWVGERIIAAG